MQRARYALVGNDLEVYRGIPEGTEKQEWAGFQTSLGLRTFSHDIWLRVFVNEIIVISEERVAVLIIE